MGSDSLLENRGGVQALLDVLRVNTTLEGEWGTLAFYAGG
jgi:hypothetical protein